MKKVLVAVLAGGALLTAGTPALAQSAKTALGPYGYGTVKLGMSAKQAKATGAVVLKRAGEAGSCSGWDLKALPSGKDGVGLYISKKRGVAVIFAAKGVKTPEGIGLGSTIKQIKKAYPGVKTAASGFPYTTVPGNSKAYYSFLLSKGKVYEMALGLKTQDCVN
ncbi:hypothetical protein ACIBQ1_28435 [Nonomuraea sp. NPDC050153]|uniref:hypothetical protein n=1 Tax=Nonomuraea sp. NPDC050153 TaxID=3364359 RepID=UPI00379A050A